MPIQPGIPLETKQEVDGADPWGKARVSAAAIRFERC